MIEGDVDAGGRRARTRRAASSGALAASILILAIAAARGVLDGWLLGGAVVAVALSAFLIRDRSRTEAVRAEAGGSAPRGIADALLARIPDPVILVDRRALVLEANAAARVLLPALKLNHPLSFALRSPDVLDGIDRVFRTGEAQRVEYGERIPTERAFEVLIGPLETDTANLAAPSGVMLFFRDQTSARRLEAMRVDFVANASHELRTPLASLLGFIETLQGPARNDPAARERFLGIMRGQAQRMTRLIDDLLSLSRIEMQAHVPPKDIVDLRSVVSQIADTLAAMAREQGVRIELALPDDPVQVQGDRDELLRVAENLIENAIKYGDGGGRVEVALTREGEGASPLVRFSVRDFGPGIAAEHLPRLTERFYRVDVGQSREKGGTGLGLAIVKHIVNRHRGRLTIESPAGEGATFTVTLPESSAG